MTVALVGFLLPGLLVAQAALPPATVAPGDRVVVTVTDHQQTIRGRISEVTPDALLLDDDGTRVRLPLATVQQVDRVSDSLWNGTAIGAALGGGSAIVAMAKACSNTNCADTSSNLDPRMTLLGTLVGAGIGALVDAAIDGHETVYRAGSAPLSSSSQSITRKHGMVFARVGRAGFSDDEGSLGSGATVGVGVVVPLGRRFGVQDRRTTGRSIDGSSGAERLRYRSEWGQVHGNGTARDREGADLFPSRQGDSALRGNRRGPPRLETYLHILHLLHRTWRNSRRRAIRSLSLSLERGQPRVRRRLRRARHAGVLHPERPHARPEPPECLQLRTTHSGRGIPLLNRSAGVPRARGKRFGLTLEPFQGLASNS